MERRFGLRWRAGLNFSSGLEETVTSEQVKAHYAEVARMVRDAQKDSQTGFHIVWENRAACAIAGTTNGMLAADEYLRLLEEVGFVQATLEPKTVYTREVLREKAQRKGREAHYDRISEADIDSKTGSVIIVARA